MGRGRGWWEGGGRLEVVVTRDKERLTTKKREGMGNNNCDEGVGPIYDEVPPSQHKNEEDEAIGPFSFS